MFEETPKILLKVRKNRNSNTFGKKIRKFHLDTMNTVATTLAIFFAQLRRTKETITLFDKIKLPLKCSPGHVKFSFDDPAEKILSDSQKTFEHSPKSIDKKRGLVNMFVKTSFWTHGTQFWQRGRSPSNKSPKNFLLKVPKAGNTIQILTKKGFSAHLKCSFDNSLRLFTNHPNCFSVKVLKLKKN